MRDVERRKLEKFERQEAFMVDNAADFAVGSVGNTAAVVNRAIIAEMNALAAEQVSGGSSAAQAVGNKDEDLDELWQMMKNMNRAANAFEDEIEGGDLKFRLPRNRSEQNVLATARAFYADSESLVETFVEYGLSQRFREALGEKIASITEQGSNADSSIEQRAGATGGLLDAAQRGMANSRKLDAIVRIKYASNAQKLAAWTVAAHLDRAPKPKTPSAPPT